MTRPLARRTALLFAGTALLAASPAARAATLIPTPEQTLGPFYPPELPLDHDNDLVQVTGTATQAIGQITHVFGRVLDLNGQPIAGAKVEIWQCDASGLYLHPRSGGSGPLPSGFQGYGQTLSAADGAYRFRTIKPVAYPGRTPHIHFAISGDDFELVTQMYVAGEPQNERDGVLNSIGDRAERASVIVALTPDDSIEAGALRGQFDIVIGRNP